MWDNSTFQIIVKKSKSRLTFSNYKYLWVKCTTNLHPPIPTPIGHIKIYIILNVFAVMLSARAFGFQRQCVYIKEFMKQMFLFMQNYIILFNKHTYYWVLQNLGIESHSNHIFS